MTATLYYVHDPMCSWCWAFAPTLKELKAGLPPDIVSKNVLGGLAADSSEPMPEPMKQQLQATWRRIVQTVPGTEFNHDFWRQCQPRRSTYPACRAVLAARSQNPQFEQAMIEAIQQAYYLHAQNPSDNATLISLAEQIGCDVNQFSTGLDSAETNAALLENIQFAHSLGAPGFPSLFVHTSSNELHHIPVNYNGAVVLLEQIAAAVNN